ncbi:MAG TPA: bifunctional diaminohydroxyphosphoribosylaminopyrimidine deaminase/5-amino-6-(5-phosphoribosylamino)uracil reductase RibD [Candidatus Sulfotelmatobacter sp.]|nr:bifunctional diaminohydroxyphosphoribosylaminopyrimidine deaminase/5-amino-6-(5-phosphoribosylamino)uracil reductase RibD [Candidatus Sulfotelmatobacter sp.]
MSTRSSSSERDDYFMSGAIIRALRGVALAHPNPIVGAVLVKSGRVVGEGFHDYDKRDHAEVVALKRAGKNARGATLYVTLEPCCTTGRTGPCTNAIIAAGVKRVVASMPDPNHAVAGRGFRQLRRAGIRVDVGLWEEEARRWNEDFAKWIRTGLPFVTLKTALTLDGQIAERAESVTWITSKRSRDSVQKLRHEADALLTGIGTILADDPRLTDRSGEPRRRRLLRVVLDSDLRLPLRSNLVTHAKNDVLVFTRQSPDSSRARALSNAGVEVRQIRGEWGRIDLKQALRELGKRAILNLLIEAGAEINGAALQAGIVDKMILFYAPRVMGTGGVPMARIPSRWFSKSPGLKNLTLNQSGPDFVVQGYFRDVYGDHRARRKN